MESATRGGGQNLGAQRVTASEGRAIPAEVVWEVPVSTKAKKWGCLMAGPQDAGTQVGWQGFSQGPEESPLPAMAPRGTRSQLLGALGSKLSLGLEADRHSEVGGSAWCVGPCVKGLQGLAVGLCDDSPWPSTRPGT